MTIDLTRLSATALARRLDDGSLKAETLAAALLERIKARDNIVRAWAHLDPQLVLRQARAIDASPRRGLLSGIPVGIKDIMDTADQPTAYGSPIYAGHQPRTDASLVAMLRAAGALIMGKTITTEFAFRHPNVTRNPHNPEHTPGGSSSGSAAAVADFQVPLGTGTQTAGSIIRPAAYCGVVGYKPTFGEIPAVGVKACAWSLDTMGFMAREVSDIAMIRRVFAGVAAKAPSEKAPVMGLYRTGAWSDAEPSAQAAFDAAAKVLESAGAKIKDVALPADWKQLADAQRVIMFFEMARSLADEASRHADRLSATIQQKLAEGRQFTFDQYRAAQELAQRCRGKMESVFADIDVILTPSAMGEALRGLTSTGEPVFNGVWTLLHLPCITLPSGKGPSGLPLGIQLIGAQWKDDALLACAAWAERLLAPHVRP